MMNFSKNEQDIFQTLRLYPQIQNPHFPSTEIKKKNILKSIQCKKTGLLFIRSEYLRKRGKQIIISQEEKIKTNMMCMMGARNSSGFSNSVEQKILPGVDHITYEGVFNELKFDVGQKSKKVVDLHFGYARYQFQKSKYDSNINDYLALFFKSERDGADRDDRQLNAVICLDISGSMGGGLGVQHSKQSLSRLKLSVEAIKMFISRMRPDDSIGLVTFNHDGQIIFPQIRKDQMSPDTFAKLDAIVANGGTTISSGLKTSQIVLNAYREAHNGCADAQNRIIMMTDVGDNSFSAQGPAVNHLAAEGIHLTIVGISTEFRSQICEQFKNTKGFNYFCAVNEADIKKYIFETFDFGFFPVAHDIKLEISSPDISRFQVYGSTDKELVAKYNKDFEEGGTTFTISKMPTVFPSEIEIHVDKVFTYGGLVLLKLKRRSKEAYFKGEVTLSYRTHAGEYVGENYPLSYQFPPNEQYFSEECLHEAIEGYTFVSEMRSLLKEAEGMSKQKLRIFLPVLEQLKEITPKSKAKELQGVRAIIEK